MAKYLHTAPETRLGLDLVNYTNGAMRTVVLNCKLINDRIKSISTLIYRIGRDSRPSIGKRWCQCKGCQN